MTDRERALEEGRRLSDEMGQQAEQFIMFQLSNPSPECTFPRERFANQIADAILEAEAKGVEWDTSDYVSEGHRIQRAANLRAQKTT